MSAPLSAPDASLAGAPVRSEFARRLLDARRAQGLTQRALAARAGLAPSSISKIENARVSPTYDVMLRIAAALSVDVALLLRPGPAAEASLRETTARLVVDRAETRTRHPAGVYDYAPMTLALARRIMDPTLIHVNATTRGDFPEWVRHEGEEFVLVLSGQVTLHTEHYAPVVLGTGDSVYYDAAMGHLFTADAPGATILNITAICRHDRQAPQ
ncbi:MAG: helix-turn-helix domain-containing protein [Rhodobacteraceae bacterium]|nr:helix-turn-helix domain-containing protein [Paracoccaceae bacterium]